MNATQHYAAGWAQETAPVQTAPAATLEGKAGMKKKIKKAHRKAKFAGVLYLLGLILLFAFLFVSSEAILAQTFFKVGDWNVSLTNFYKPLLSFEAKLTENTLVKIPVAVIYSLMLVVGLVNLLRSFACLKWLSKKKATRSTGYNRNVYAMDKMASLYSGTLVTIVLGTVVACTITKVTVGTIAYAALGAAIFLHFVAGLVGGKISLFDVEDTVVETARESKIGVFFWRNLLQILFTGGIVYLFVKATTVRDVISTMASGKSLQETLGISSSIFGVLSAGLQVALLLWIFVLVNHALRPTEFNRNGIKGKGMKNYKVFSMFAAITSAAWLVVSFLSDKNFTSDSAFLQIVILTVLAIVAFILDCVVKTKAQQPAAAEDKQEESTETAQTAQTEVLQPYMSPAYRVPLQCITQPGIFLQPNGIPVMVMPMQRGYAFPVGTATPTPITTAGKVPMAMPAMPAPQPAPVQPVQPIQPVQNAPQPVSAPVEQPTAPEMTAIAPVQNTTTDEPNLPKTADDILGLTYQWEANGKERTVACPTCKKTLTVKEGAPGYRCPDCGKVFLLRKPQPVQPVQPAQTTEE